MKKTQTDDYYDYGWNDAVDNKTFKVDIGINYRDGYKDCEEAKNNGIKVEKI